MAVAEPEEAIFKLLKDDAPVGAIAADRIYPQAMPSGADIVPAVVYQRVSAVTERSLNEKVGLSRPRVQVDCYANDYLAAARLGTAVRAALDGFMGTVTVAPSTTVRIAVQLLDSRDLYEVDTRRHRRSLDFGIWAHTT